MSRERSLLAAVAELQAQLRGALSDLAHDERNRMSHIDPTADPVASRRQTLLEERDVALRAQARAGDDADARKAADAALAKIEKAIAAEYSAEASAK